MVAERVSARDAPTEAEALRRRRPRRPIRDERSGARAEADRLHRARDPGRTALRTIRPSRAAVFAPLGFDWQLTVGVLTSFLAREVFVSTMSVLVGGADDADVDEGVIARIRSVKRDDGTLLFAPATAASALVFFVLAMQCLPTLAVTRKETGSWRYPVFQFAYMSTLAYAAAFVVHQALLAVGVQ